MASAVFMRGKELRAKARADDAHPFADQPDWVVGMLALMFKDSQQPAPRKAAAIAQAEWIRRRSSALDMATDNETWRVTITHWHDTEFGRMLVLPKGARIVRTRYEPEGDQQVVLVCIPNGSNIAVLDPQRVRLKRLF